MKNMKKVLLFALVAIMLLGLVSCGNQSSKNKFIKLKDNEVLKIGQNSRPIMNYENESKTVKYVTYTSAVTYTLKRSFYQNANGSQTVEYNNYYYYWEATATTQEKILGNQTTTTVYTYEYLPYGESEDLLLKATTHTHVSFDYDGGWLELPCDVTTNLSNYFASFQELEEKCPDLAKLIDTSKTQKVYVDIIVPDTISSSETYHSTYYYIEEK
ncbi:MAG: hypothetical protein IJZ04_07560 [Clostridia bacterium]|nr:hypothetical protein [Clostridia bacterium]